jgi:lysophospholipase L1-like esterase
MGVAAIGLALLTSEFLLLRGALGYHGIAEAAVFAHDDSMGWVLRPGAAAMSSALEFKIMVRTDAMGLRSMRSDDSWRGFAQRVLVVGDSFAFGWGVPGEQTFSARLQDALADKGIRAAVLNAGVPGYSTDQYYLQWRRMEAAIRPNVVIVLMGANDPPADKVSSVRMGDALYYKPFFRVVDGGLELQGVPVPDKRLAVSPTRLEPFKAWTRPLALYALVRQVRDTRLASRPSERKDVVSMDANALSPTREILTAFNRDVRAQGGRLLVVLMPSPAIRAAVGRICNDEGIPFLDLEPTFANRVDLTFKYDGHWNASGHRAAAGAAVSELARLLR